MTQAAVMNVQGELEKCYLVGIENRRAYIFQVSRDLVFHVHVEDIVSSQGEPMRLRWRYLGKTMCGWFNEIKDDHLYAYPDKRCEGTRTWLSLSAVIDAGDRFEKASVEPDAVMRYDVPDRKPKIINAEGVMTARFVFTSAEGTSKYSREINYSGELVDELAFMQDFKRLIDKYRV